MNKPQINREMAIALLETEFWKTMSARDVALFQLSVHYLCMPFEIFHEALEEVLGRSVWTHEFALNWEGLIKELLGEVKQPSFEDITNLIPKEKLLIIAKEEEIR